MPVVPVASNPVLSRLFSCLMLLSAGLVASLIPAIRAYRMSLSDGLAARM
jgi:hypothetical protein